VEIVYSWNSEAMCELCEIKKSERIETLKRDGIKNNDMNAIARKKEACKKLRKPSL